MCGICGIALSSRSDVHLDRSLIERMRDVLAHRGPDAAGVFVEQGIGLGHRRLSIVDVVHGQQPMASDDGSLRLVYNGEVYNHRELSAQLRAAGVRYRTHCDTETVLRVFETDGTRAPRRLRGMFAFAIWNRSRRELFLARDRLGVKPLYYALTPDGSIYFGSEIKAILTTGAITSALDTRVLPDYLANHAPSGEETMFAGIKRLLPGHTLLWTDGRVRVEQYWDLDPRADTQTAARKESDLVAEYRERLREAVRLRLMADVPLGSFLSGGIDSAAITGLMTELTGGRVKTFSVGFAEREANELEYARVVSSAFRTDHHEVVVTPEQFFSSLPRLVWHEDEPIAHPSSIPLHFVSALAANHVKVVLTGEGSDETLAGYGRYLSTKYNLAVGQGWERAGGRHLRPLSRRVIDSLPRTSRLRRRLARTFLYLSADLETLYFDNFSVFSRAQQQQLLSPDMQCLLCDVGPYGTIEKLLDRRGGARLLDQLLYADTKTYLHELLMKQDQMSMSASIESRVPFLDHPLMEFASSLPERMKLRGRTTKYVLRAAMRGVLPETILARPKMGFPVPVGAWFRGAFRNVVDEYVLGDRAMARGLFDASYVRQLRDEHSAQQGNHAERLWSLVNLEIWHRMFVDGESIADTSDGMRSVLGAGARDVGPLVSIVPTLTTRSVT